MPQKILTEADLIAQRVMMTPPDDKLDYMLIQALDRDASHFSHEQKARFSFIIAHLALMVGAAGAGREDLFKDLMALRGIPGGTPLSSEELRFGLYYLEVCTMMQKGVPGLDSEGVRRLVAPIANESALKSIFNH